MVEILKRLPVESVVKCRSVCKTWNSLITNPSFISTHLQTSLSKPHIQLLLSYSKNGKKNFFLHFDNDDCDEFKQLHFPVAFNGYLPFFQVVGSCNGLVCLRHYPDILETIFWNSSIQKYVELPKPSITCGSDYDAFVFGFGFDSRTNDHKLHIVAFEEGKTSINTYLFSLNENSWKRVAATFPEYAMEGQSLNTGASQMATFVNGAFHWVEYQSEQEGGFRCMILGFDISTEQFFVIRKNREVLLEVMGSELASYDLNCQQVKYLGIKAEYGFASINSYVESLVLLDKGLEAGSVSYVNHANDDSYSEEESEMA
ncbi:hypothetical protein PTKIN_Ptkin14bG0107500 [Pterospermum kingtungense]